MSDLEFERIPKEVAERAEHLLLVRRAQAGDILPLARWLWPSLVLDGFQEDMLCALFDPAIFEVWVKGNTGCGKDAAAGLGICLYFHVWHEDAKCILTSNTYDHCKGVLFRAEVLKWRKLQRLGQLHDHGSMRAEEIVDNEKHYVTIVNPDHDESFSGRHGDHTLFVMDEASGIADSRFRLAMTQAKKLLALSNPRVLSGAFRRAFSSCANPDRNQTVTGPYGGQRFITVSGLDCMNVRLQRLKAPIGPIGGIEIDGRRYEHGEPIPTSDYEKVRPIIPGQTCYDTYRGHLANPNPRWVDVFAHGKFPTEDAEKQVILGSWLDRHVQSWCAGLPVTHLALDVAASMDGDETILAAGSVKGCAGLHARQHADTMATVGWVLSTCREAYGLDLAKGEHPIAVDMDGVGKGVGDRLKELGARVVEHHGNTSANDPTRYANRRAEVYGVLGERLNPLGAWQADCWPLPHDEKLLAELAAPEKIYGSDGTRYSITPKERRGKEQFKGDTLKEKLGRSPDRADAVTMLYWICEGDVMDEARPNIRSLTKEELGELPSLAELMGECQFVVELPDGWLGADGPVKDGKQAQRFETRDEAAMADQGGKVKPVPRR